jgi:hypothetical protein
VYVPLRWVFLVTIVLIVHCFALIYSRIWPYQHISFLQKYCIYVLPGICSFYTAEHLRRSHRSDLTNVSGASPCIITVNCCLICKSRNLIYNVLISTDDLFPPLSYFKTCLLVGKQRAQLIYSCIQFRSLNCLFLYKQKPRQRSFSCYSLLTSRLFLHLQYIYCTGA